MVGVHQHDDGFSHTGKLAGCNKAHRSRGWRQGARESWAALHGGCWPAPLVAPPDKQPLLRFGSVACPPWQQRGGSNGNRPHVALRGRASFLQTLGGEVCADFSCELWM
eukprot:364250-Chlamydomonas_euryale.AAC.3